MIDTTERWYEDNEEVSEFMHELEDHMKDMKNHKKIHYDIILNDWDWKDGYLTFRGFLIGSSSFDHDFKDADDYDTTEYDVDTDIEYGKVPKSMLDRMTRDEFFKYMVKDIIDTSENCIDEFAELYLNGDE